MLKLRKIAVTGNLCSGKTTVCNFLSNHGFYVVNTDKIVHDLLEFDRECVLKVKSLLGDDIETDGLINRKKVSHLVFNNRNKLQALEKILHPLVFKRVKDLYLEHCKTDDKRNFVVEVPLLYEAGWDSFFDEVILVICSESLSLERAHKKGLTNQEVESRISRMYPNQEKIEKADYIVFNNETLQSLKQQLINIIKQINKTS